jgi:hypothetical protein
MMTNCQSSLQHVYGTASIIHSQVWLGSRDLSGNYGQVATLNITTPDVTGPSFVLSTPAVAPALATEPRQVNVTVAIDEAGTVACRLQQCLVPFDEGLCKAQVAPAPLDLLFDTASEHSASHAVQVPQADTAMALQLRLPEV